MAPWSRCKLEAEVEKLRGVIRGYGQLYNRFNDTDEGIAARKTLCLPMVAAQIKVTELRGLGWEIGANGA